MQVTTEGERIVRLLAEVISAKGFERDSYFASAKNIIDGLPKLEGTVHVNRALTLKFLPNYMFGTEGLERHRTAPRPRRRRIPLRPGPDSGPQQDRLSGLAPGLRRFAELPNVSCFREQAELLVGLIEEVNLTTEQMTTDLDFQQSLAQLFTLVPYGQLILEQAEIADVEPDIVDLVFETLVRDFSATAVELHGKASSTAAQQDWALASVRKPVVDEPRGDRVYTEVRALSDAYVMPA